MCTHIHREKSHISPAWVYQVFQRFLWKHWKEYSYQYDLNEIPTQFYKLDSNICRMHQQKKKKIATYQEPIIMTSQMKPSFLPQISHLSQPQQTGFFFVSKLSEIFAKDMGVGAKPPFKVTVNTVQLISYI